MAKAADKPKGPSFATLEKQMTGPLAKKRLLRIGGSGVISANAQDVPGTENFGMLADAAAERIVRQMPNNYFDLAPSQHHLPTPLFGRLANAVNQAAAEQRFKK